MKFITFVQSSDDLRACVEAPGVEEVLIEAKQLAREGRLTVQDAEALGREARDLGLRPVLVWDILMTEREFKLSTDLISQMDLAPFVAVRTQCPGAALWVKNNITSKALHFIVENSNHNLPGLKRWVEQLAPQRMVLSIQLPEEKLIRCCKELGVECEVLGAGKILLFYSKRQLLRQNFTASEEYADAQWIYADSLSEESASRPFPTIENEHGTFMYLNKDHFILDKLSNLEVAGIHAVRIDLKDLRDGGSGAEGVAELCRRALARDPEISSAWSRPTSAPFFKRNKTDKQFSRMKPQTRLQRDQNCLAEVVSVERGEALSLLTLREFGLSDTKFKFVAHDGSEVPVMLDSWTDLSGSPVNACSAQRVIRCNWVKGVRPGAILVRDENISH
jgi:putative protease